MNLRRPPAAAVVLVIACALVGLPAPPRPRSSRRLAWVFSPRFAGDSGSWEVFVDAHDGEVFALVDRNEYLHNVKGAIFRCRTTAFGGGFESGDQSRWCVIS